MGSRHDLKSDVRNGMAGDDSRADGVEAALLDAKERLIDGRDRLGDAADDAVTELRDDAGEALHQVRRRARRLRRRALKRARVAGGRWRGVAVAIGAVAGASAIGIGLVKQRRSLQTVVASGAKKVRTVAARA